MKNFNEILQSLVAEGDNEQLEAIVAETTAELNSRRRQYMREEPLSLADFEPGEAGIHEFASGAKSSGRKPNYAGCMPIYAFQRFAAHRGFGDAKFGTDNYLKGCRDEDFILDRINHGIEHLLHLAFQIRNGIKGSDTAGQDDAAAVMCAGMFAMVYQQMREPNVPRRKPGDGPSAFHGGAAGYGHGV